MTEIGLSFSALRTQLENEKSSLYQIDENIKKIVQTSSGRFPNDRYNPAGEYARGGNRLGGRNSFPDNTYNKNDEHFGKRKQETKTVFSRLSARVADSDGEEECAATEGPGAKRARVPSAVSRELPTRAAVLRAQGGDERANSRNRRMFGSLLGTLHKFKQEEIVLQTKEEKRAQVERKIEEAARQEKEREQKQRKTLFAEREHKKVTIKALEAKMGRVAEFERWEASQKHLANFILTKAKPHVYWIPKKMTEKADEKLSSSRKFHEKFMTQKRAELQEELQRIEQRVLRPRQPHAPHASHASHAPANENLPPTRGDAHVKQEHDDKGKRRDKFAMDVDKDESDGDDAHEDDGNGAPPPPGGANGDAAEHTGSDAHKVAETEIKMEKSELETKDQMENSTMKVEDMDIAVAPAPAPAAAAAEPTPATQAPPDESTPEDNDQPAKDTVETAENHS